jgi:hypothetical protein
MKAVPAFEPGGALSPDMSERAALRIPLKPEQHELLSTMFLFIRHVLSVVAAFLSACHAHLPRSQA